MLSFFKRDQTRPEELTCGPGCVCVRAFKCYNSLEADFRRTREETGEELASELLMKRAGYGMEPVRINRAGRCLTVWKEELREEKEWLDEYPLMSEEDKRFSREADERLRREQKEQAAQGAEGAGGGRAEAGSGGGGRAQEARGDGGGGQGEA